MFASAPSSFRPSGGTRMAMVGSCTPEGDVSHDRRPPAEHRGAMAGMWNAGWVTAQRTPAADRPRDLGRRGLRAGGTAGLLSLHCALSGLLVVLMLLVRMAEMGSAMRA